MKFVLTLAFCCIALFGAKSQNILIDKIAAGEQRAHEGKLLRSTSRSLNNYNLVYQQCFWNVDPAVNYIKGKIVSHFIPSVSISQIEFDLSGFLSIDSVTYHGIQIPATQLTGNLLQIDFPSAIPSGTLDSVTVYYQGTPGSSGFGSFIQSTHNGGLDPIVWTLSQPYGALDWWPCKQDLQDKIDSIDIFITHPVAYRAASNGVLVSETISGPNKTAHWKHRYPIATYLVALAVTNYAVYSDFSPFGSYNVEILNYVFPEDSAIAAGGTVNTIAQMQLYDTLFGIYPFHAEKYGHAQFGWGGGMEHQTMSFMGNFHYELIAHELAHQWFGDKVTCGSWEDIFLNEGFATYLSGLCYEHLAPVYWSGWKKAVMGNVVSAPDGSVFCPDTLNVSRLFDGRLTYAKGAMILHQLRWVMGDSAFYAGVNNYLNDAGISFGFSRLDGFKAHLSAAASQDLTWYFNDWYYGEGYPVYDIQWTQDGANNLTITVNQTQSHPSVPFYELPIPLTLKNATQDTVIVLNHTVSGQVFNVPINFTADSLKFDVDTWIISGNNTIANVSEVIAASGINVYPTLATETLFIDLLNNYTSSSVMIYSAAGDVVLSQALSANQAAIPVGHLSKGVYMVKVTTGDHSVVKKIVIG